MSTGFSDLVTSHGTIFSGRMHAKASQSNFGTKFLTFRALLVINHKVD